MVCIGSGHVRMSNRERRKLARAHLQPRVRARATVQRDEGPPVASLVRPCDCNACREVRRGRGRRIVYAEPGDHGMWPAPVVHPAEDRWWDKGRRFRGPLYPLSYECRQLALAPTARPLWSRKDPKPKPGPGPDDLLECDCAMCREAALAGREDEAEIAALAADSSPMAHATFTMRTRGVRVVAERTRMARGPVVYAEPDDVGEAVMQAMAQATEAPVVWREAADGE